MDYTQNIMDDAGFANMCSRLHDIGWMLQV